MKLNKENFETEVLKSSIPVLVDFYADWCGPCKMMAPVVDKLEQEAAGRYKVGKLNVDQETEIAINYRVMSIPTFIVFQDGKPASVTVGAVPEQELRQKLEL